jgi:hypothetical protein
MRRDFLVISAGVLAFYAALSMFWSSPEKPPRAHTIQQIVAAPELKLVSEQSPYMRTTLAAGPRHSDQDKLEIRICRDR